MPENVPFNYSLRSQELAALVNTTLKELGYEISVSKGTINRYRDGIIPKFLWVKSQTGLRPSYKYANEATDWVILAKRIQLRNRFATEDNIAEIFRSAVQQWGSYQDTLKKLLMNYEHDEDYTTFVHRLKTQGLRLLSSA